MTKRQAISALKNSNEVYVAVHLGEGEAHHHIAISKEIARQHLNEVVNGMEVNARYYESNKALYLG